MAVGSDLVDAAAAEANGQGATVSGVEGEAYGLYQSSHLSIQEYCFTKWLVKEVERPTERPTDPQDGPSPGHARSSLLSKLKEYDDIFYQNSMSLLGEVDEGRMAALIPTFQSSNCSMGFLSHLVTLHHKFPQLVDLNVAGNSKLTSLDWMAQQHISGLRNIQSLDLSTCTALRGELPPLALVLLLEGKANLNGIGSLKLPSSSSIHLAPSDIFERFQNVAVSVDLRRDAIGFRIAGDLECMSLLSNIRRLVASRCEVKGNLTKLHFDSRRFY